MGIDFLTVLVPLRPGITGGWARLPITNATSFNSGMTGTGTGSGALTVAFNIAAFLNAGFSSWNYWELGYILGAETCNNCNLVGDPAQESVQPPTACG